MRHPWLALICSCVVVPAYAETQCTDCPGSDALSIDAVYTAETWRNFPGGAARGNRYLDNLDLTASFDGARFGAPGLQVFGYLLYNNGHSISELTNVAQGTSNIESSRAVRLYELWTQWAFGESNGSVRFGLYDLNSEFDSIETAGLFINPSHGIGADFAQTGENGPSIFPTTSLGVRALKSFDAWTVQAAVLDGVPGDADRPDRSGIHLSSEEGALVVGELNYRTESGARFGGGYWRYTAEFDDLTAMTASGEATQRDDNAGHYLIAESPLMFSENENLGTRLFARTGMANDRINAIRRYYGAGIARTGVGSRVADRVGFAIAVAELGDPFRQAEALAGTETTRREYNYELTYRSEITDWLALQMDLQYVDNPGMTPFVESDWAVGLRLEVGRSWAW